MGVEAFRVRDFMGFEDSGWIALRPINLLFGRNATGKSAILRALLILKQSLTSPPSLEPLTLFSENGIDAGSFQDIVHRKTQSLGSEDDESEGAKNDAMAFGFRCRIRPELLQSFQPEERRLKAQATGEPIVSDEEAWATLELTFGPRQTSRRIVLQSIEIWAPWLNTHGESTGSLIFAAEWLESDLVDGMWVFESDLLKQHLDLTVTNLWVGVKDFGVGIGFLPILPKLEYDTTEDEFENDYDIVRKLLDEFRQVISDFLQSLHYLGPVRREPRRFYYAPGAMSSRVGLQGANTVESFLATWDTKGWKSDLEQVNSRLEDLGLGIQLEVHALDKERKPYQSIFEIRLREDAVGIETSLCDTGFGWSQMLPIVLECVLAEEGATIIIEEPESHLHPSAQALLGDLFIRTTKEGKRFLIETHCENLLLRFRRRLSQTSGEISEAAELSLQRDDFRAYFVDRQECVSQIEALEFDEWGDYTYRPPRFGDFFGQDFEELVKMKNARRGRA